MGIMVYSLLWVMQDFVHQTYEQEDQCKAQELPALKVVHRSDFQLRDFLRVLRGLGMIGSVGFGDQRFRRV